MEPVVLVSRVLVVTDSSHDFYCRCGFPLQLILRDGTLQLKGNRALVFHVPLEEVENLLARGYGPRGSLRWLVFYYWHSREVRPVLKKARHEEANRWRELLHDKR